jgi:replicative DNA helicase
VVWSWPFRALDTWTNGGLRRKQNVLIGGWTSHGKSIVFDQILHCMAGHGLRVHAYINEMSEEERTDREVTRLSGIPAWQVQRHKVPASSLGDEEQALARINVGLTECAGWDAAEIARHIRWNRWDVVGVDIVHEIAHRDERDLAEIGQVLRAAAKQSNSALIMCVHLNDNRVTTPQRPAPVMRDIRGTGMFSRGADIVLLVHRDDNEQGIPTERGMLFAAKIRGGQPNAMALRFDEERLRFVPVHGEAA